MNRCAYCKKLTENPKFCSRSCSTTVANTAKPKRIAESHYCLKCQIELPNKRSYCDDCLIPEDVTLSEAIYTKHHRSSAFALVRTRARSLTRKWPKICKYCGYSKHVEVCHIKPISEYPLNTMISAINNPCNLILLCPNCHWEFDHEKKYSRLDSNQRPTV